MFAAGAAMGLMGGVVQALSPHTPEGEDAVLKAVRDEIQNVENKLDTKMEGLSQTMEKLHEKMDAALNQLHTLVTLVSNTHLQQYTRTFNNIHARHQTWIFHIKKGTSAKIMLKEVLGIHEAQYTHWRAELEVKTWRDNLKLIADCDDCGGSAAAALWYHRYVQARLELFDQLYTLRRLQGKTVAAEDLVRELLPVMETVRTAGVEVPGLAPWLHVHPDDLTKYMGVSAERHRLVYDLVTQLKNKGDPEKQVEAAGLIGNPSGKSSDFATSFNVIKALIGLVTDHTRVSAIMTYHDMIPILKDRVCLIAKAPKNPSPGHYGLGWHACDPTPSSDSSQSEMEFQITPSSIKSVAMPGSVAQLYSYEGKSVQPCSDTFPCKFARPTQHWNWGKLDSMSIAAKIASALPYFMMHGYFIYYNTEGYGYCMALLKNLNDLKSLDYSAWTARWQGCISPGKNQPYRTVMHADNLPPCVAAVRALAVLGRQHFPVALLANETLLAMYKGHQEATGVFHPCGLEAKIALQILELL